MNGGRCAWCAGAVNSGGICLRCLAAGSQHRGTYECVPGLSPRVVLLAGDGQGRGCYTRGVFWHELHEPCVEC